MILLPEALSTNQGSHFFADGSLGRKQEITDSHSGSQIGQTVSPGTANWLTYSYCKNWPSHQTRNVYQLPVSPYGNGDNVNWGIVGCELVYCTSSGHETVYLRDL